MQMTELKELITALHSAVDLGLKISTDGKVGVTDLPYVYDLIKKLNPAIKGLKDIPNEFSAMSEADVQDLVQFAITGLKIPEGKAKNAIQISLNILSELVLLFKALKK